MPKLLVNYTILLIISAFGPYLSLSLGIKMDNVIAFSFAVLFMILALTRNDMQIKRSILPILVVWICAFSYLLIRTFLGDGLSNFPSVLAEIKNFSQPIAIMLPFLIVWGTTNESDWTELLRKSCKLVVVLFCLNTLWSLLGFFTDLSFVNQYFWRGEDGTAAKAMTNGRYSGIFNQPMEAGFAYSLGLLSWLYLAENRFIKVNMWTTLQIILLVVGGLLTVSKIFLFGGMFLFAIAIISIKQLRMKMFKFVGLFILTGIPVYYFLTKTWEGVVYLNRFFMASSYNQGFINMMTAGRFGGDDAALEKAFMSIWEEKPIIGEGLGSQTFVDSGFYHFFSTGGLIGFLFYVAILIVFCYLSLRFSRKSKNSESKFFFFLTFLIVFSSLGAPVLTLNRSSVLLWVFVGLLLSYLSSKNKTHKST